MNETEMMGMQMAFFPYEIGSGKASGALVQGGQQMPEVKGPLIYLNANPSMDSILEMIPQMGGTVLMPKTQISPEVGYMAQFTDTEGNKLALHSQN
jgi:predicted enzyme related to lactoylglutathione lyase